MADKVGGVEFDVTVNSSGAVESSKEVIKANDKVEASFEKVEQSTKDTGGAYSKLTPSIRQMGEQYTKLTSSLQQAISSQLSMGNTIDKNNRVIDKNGKEVAEATAALKSYATQARSLGANIDSTNSALTRMMSTTQAVNTATTQARASTVNLRHAAGQLGFQVQDIAVQLQMGTNALTVLGQQGSQIAGAFGPTGAIVGGFIAVGAAIGTALLPSLFESTSAIEDLEKAMDALNRTAQTGGDGLKEFNQEIKNLAEVSKVAAEARIGAAMVAAQKAAKSAANAIQDEISDSFDLGGILKSELEDVVEQARIFGDAAGAKLLTGVGQGGANQIADDIGKSFGLAGDDARATGKEIVELIANLNHPVLGGAEAFQALEDRLAVLSKGTGKTSDKVFTMIGNLAELFDKGRNASKSIDGLKESLDSLGKGEGLGATSNELSEIDEKLKSLAQELALSEAGLEGNASEAMRLQAAFQFGVSTFSEMPEEAQKMVNRLIEIGDIEKENAKKRIEAKKLETEAAIKEERRKNEILKQFGVVSGANDEANRTELEKLKSKFEQERVIVAEHHALMLEQKKLSDEQLVELERQTASQITAINQRESDARLAIQQKHENVILQLKMAAVANAAALLSQFAGQSKVAAIAAIALNKGLALAQNTQNTLVAQTRALAELGPIAGPPMAAKIGTYGAANAAIIAATGLAQAANAARGSAPAGLVGLSGGQGSSAAGGSLGPQQTSRNVSISLTGDNFGSGGIRGLIDEINEAVGDGVNVFASGG